MSEFPHLEEFSFEKYAKKELAKQEGSIENEIKDAGLQQEERKTSTPDVDWETRYKELEKHNSRQAQELGHLRSETENYRKAFDEYLLNDPTPAKHSEDAKVEPLTTDYLLERPDEAINQAIENHPAIRQAREAADAARKSAILQAKAQFEDKHPKYQETLSDPEFANWVKGSNTRLRLAQAADQWDFDAADALFSLYESEKAITGLTAQQRTAKALQQAELESVPLGERPPEPKFSRFEMRELMIKAKNDVAAERKLNQLLPAYRAALAAGEVTD